LYASPFQLSTGFRDPKSRRAAPIVQPRPPPIVIARTQSAHIGDAMAGIDSLRHNAL
jgi:hypothetical protein